MKPLIIGESNPISVDPRHALYPLPEGCSGWRLCHVVLGMQPHDYLRAFERVDLLSGVIRWKATLAEQRAARLLTERPGQPLVLLGARVAAAFGLEFRPAPRVTFGDLDGRAIAVLPHPSGRNRAWELPGTIVRAREAVERLLAEIP